MNPSLSRSVINLPVKLPTSFDEISDEISRFTRLSRHEVEYRVWMEALETGWNVMQDSARFGVTPHTYNDKMHRLYSEGYGYIFDSLVYWARPDRQRWIQNAAERIDVYRSRTGLRSRDVRVLMLGDGAGNDSLYLVNHGLHVDYFEVPGSRTFNFAVDRFEHYGLLGTHIRLIDDWQRCMNQQYDVVMSFEVLEHLPQPIQAIRDISLMTKSGGIALITEDFGDIVHHIPTHLMVSAPLKGKTPFLFLRHSLRLSWYSRETLFKPYEFVKQDTVSVGDWAQLLTDNQIRGSYLSWYTTKLIRLIGKVPYIGGFRSRTAGSQVRVQPEAPPLNSDGQ
jgi:SAM-dependent methyltransferase